MGAQPTVLLYDGTCGFCARNIQFVLHRERGRRTLHFASLQSRVGEEVRARHPEFAAVDSVIWLEPADGARPERVLVRSAAVLSVLTYLGGFWAVLAKVGALVPRALRDAIYDFVARHRHQFIRADPSCLLPTPEQRARFLDD
jgi:predicted DCC family thiol-disulfide oxidoreductase YuxK